MVKFYCAHLMDSILQGVLHLVWLPYIWASMVYGEEWINKTQVLHWEATKPILYADSWDTLQPFLGVPLQEELYFKAALLSTASKSVTVMESTYAEQVKGNCASESYNKHQNLIHVKWVAEVSEDEIFAWIYYRALHKLTIALLSLLLLL